MPEQKTLVTAVRRSNGGDYLADDALQPLLEINGHCVESLREMAHSPDTRGDQPAVVAEIRSLWLTVSADACAQIAACPFLLVDAGFNDEPRWRALAHGGVHDTPRAAGAGCHASYFAPGLVRSVLIYGWYLARAHRQVARVALGMSPSCARSIAALSLTDLDWVSEHQPGWVRLRWESQPAIWRQFLLAAVKTDRTALQHMSLRGIQLLAAGALARPDSRP